MKAGNDDGMNPGPFDAGFVRTIAMRFWKGNSKLNDVWQEMYNQTLSNGTTLNATNLEEVKYNKRLSTYSEQLIILNLQIV